MRSLMFFSGRKEFDKVVHKLRKLLDKAGLLDNRTEADILNNITYVEALYTVFQEMDGRGELNKESFKKVIAEPSRAREIAEKYSLVHGKSSSQANLSLSRASSATADDFFPPTNAAADNENLSCSAESLGDIDSSLSSSEEEDRNRICTRRP
jgi:hypothetical protein